VKKQHVSTLTHYPFPTKRGHWKFPDRFLP